MFVWVFIYAMVNGAFQLTGLSYIRAHALVAEAHEGIRCVTCLSDLICCATINIVMAGIVARFMLGT